MDHLTTLSITGSSEEFTIPLGSLLAHSTFTLVFTPTVLVDGQWITMSSRENSYLYSFSNPPHLDFTFKASTTSTPDGSDSIPGYSLLALTLIFLASIGILRRKIATH